MSESLRLAERTITNLALRDALHASIDRVLEGEALVMPRERAPQLDLAVALETLRRQWGNTLFTALVAYHGDIGAVWEKCVGRKHNERLVEAGVLMVEHE